MSLGLHTPQAFAQSIRQRLDALPDTIPIAVVEGRSDKQMLMRSLHPDTRVVPARGKDVVLRSKAFLEKAELARLAFIVDCDGTTDGTILRDGSVIVTELRDLDADLLIGFGTLRAVAWDFFAATLQSGDEVELRTTELIEFVSGVSARLGVLLHAGRAESLPVRIYDPILQRKRRITIADLSGAAAWIEKESIPSYEDLSVALASRLGWTPSQRRLVIKTAGEGGTKKCRGHGQPSCVPCLVRRFSNGHDMVDIASKRLDQISGYSVDQKTLEISFRTARLSRDPSQWIVIEKLKRRESVMGLPLVHPDLAT